jgi:hypothetical protein
VKHSAIALGALILLTACATSSPSPRKITVMHADDLGDNPTGQLDRDNTVICDNVPIAGTHFPQRICQTVRERELARERTQTELGTQMQNLPSGPFPVAGQPSGISSPGR